MQYKYINVNLTDKNGGTFIAPLLVTGNINTVTVEGNNGLQTNIVKNIYDYTQDTEDTIYTEHTLCYAHINNYYWGGNVGSINGDYFSYKIPVTEGKTYYLQNIRHNANNEVTALFLTSDGELATSTNVNPINTNLLCITIPKNVAYIRIPTSANTKQNVMVLEDVNEALSNYIPYGNCITDYSVLIRDNQVGYTNLKQDVKPHRFYGAKVNTLGDSLTEPGMWQEKLKDLMGFAEIRNYGVGGTTVTSARGEGESTFRDRASLMDDDADLIIVFTSINDNGAAMGTKDSVDVSTIGGAGNVLASMLREKYPTATIVFTSHPHLHWNPWAGNASDMYQEVCKEYGIPFCDILRTSNIDGRNEVANKYFFTDGIHLTDAGFERIAQTIAGFLKTI